MPAPRRPIPDTALAELASHAAAQGGLIRRSQALAAGVSDEQIRTAVRLGEWAAVRSGIYNLGRALATPLLAARLLDVPGDAVLSHASAAALHGWTDVAAPDKPVLTVERPRRGALADPHAAALPTYHVTALQGMRVTTPARTVVDLLRAAEGRPAAQALADSGCRSGLTAGVPEVVGDCTRWPGIRQAREAWEHASAQPESFLESRNRVWFRDGGLPDPEMQVWVGSGSLSARLDFLFREQRTVVEADGRVKYDDPRVLWDEKRREDRLREMGFEIVRSTWADGADGGAALVVRIRRAFARAVLRAA